ncbi:Hint domain-containing protein [Falsihalocynthiibacter sp. S25ZX9]|uniref:Hint domain-containing protein n=1 Tax=Falsihalocynthiibacter sp. S25ZX9 TaxID=3240870 RepID=UPI00350F98F7
MPILYTLADDQISVSGGESLSGISQGDGTHLIGETITLNSKFWETIDITDGNGSFDDNDEGQSLSEDITYAGTDYNAGAIIEAEFQFQVQDPDGNNYTIIAMNIREPGDANTYGTIEGLAFIGPVGGFPPVGVPLTVISASEGPTPGVTNYEDYASPACFTPKTLIETASGPRAIETLSSGDLVETLDHGLKPLRWKGEVNFSRDELALYPVFEPVLIQKGALGNGVPKRDLLVSPQHRVLISDWRAELFYGEDEVLVAAKHLVNGTTISRHLPTDGVTYIHLLFDNHEVIFSEGLPSESFLPGAEVCEGMATEVQNELYALFPELEEDWSAFSAAKPSLKAYQAAPLFA